MESKYTLASIGNGIHVRTARRESMLDEYLRKQRECNHRHRDPKGMCYSCGLVDQSARRIA